MNDVEKVEILQPKVCYEVAKVEVDDKGYNRVGTELIRFVTGNPSNLTIPRKQGIRIDSLIKVLLLNAAERVNKGDISGVSVEDIKAVKDFIIQRATTKEQSL